MGKCTKMPGKKQFLCPKKVVSSLSAIMLVALVGLGGCGRSTSQPPVVKFAVFDDSRAASGATGNKNGDSNGTAALVVNTIAKDIAAQGVDFVLFPGDMVSGYTDAARLSSQLDTWKKAMAPVYDAHIPVYTTRGNHEYADRPNGAANPADPSRATYLAHFPMPTNGPTTGAAGLSEVGLTYSFVYRNVKVIGFDQYAGRSAAFNNRLFASGSNKGQMMNSWVLDEIDNSPAKVDFVMAHEGMWPTRSHPDTLANDPDSRDALVHALGIHNGAYFAGHDHQYIRGFMSDGRGDKVPALVVGTGGGGNYNYGTFDVVAAGYHGPDAFTVQKTISDRTNPYFGYLLVSVKPDNTWSAEFHGFRFNKWDNATDHSVTPIAVMDSFTSADFH